VHDGGHGQHVRQQRAGTRLPLHRQLPPGRPGRRRNAAPNRTPHHPRHGAAGPPGRRLRAQGALASAPALRGQPGSPGAGHALVDVAGLLSHGAQPARAGEGAWASDRAGLARAHASGRRAGRRRRGAGTGRSGRLAPASPRTPSRGRRLPAPGDGARPSRAGAGAVVGGTGARPGRSRAVRARAPRRPPVHGRTLPGEGVRGWPCVLAQEPGEALRRISGLPRADGGGQPDNHATRARPAAGGSRAAAGTARTPACRACPRGFSACRQACAAAAGTRRRAPQAAIR
jgi:hypothetical protein